MCLNISVVPLKVQFCGTCIVEDVNNRQPVCQLESSAVFESDLFKNRRRKKNRLTVVFPFWFLVFCLFVFCFVSVLMALFLFENSGPEWYILTVFHA